MIRLKGICKRYGSQQVLRDVDADFPDGEITGLGGPSGGGKTTLLRLVAGLERPDSGTIDGVLGKKLCFLFQEHRLLPWLTAEQNVRMVQPEAPEVPAREWLRRVGLEEAAGKLPGELSGGMCQRVAFARALAYGGDVFLLDEPFMGVDDTTKRTLYALLRRETAGKTVLLATHSEEEKRLLCSRSFLLADGALRRAPL